MAVWRLLRENAVAVAAPDNQVLVAGEGLLTLHDATGDELTRVTAKQRTTALTRCGDSIVLGSEGGALDRIAIADGRQERVGKPSDMPPAAVTSLLSGPMRTLVAGYSDGQVGVWCLDTGSLLLTHRLHGPVKHLRLHSDQLLVATDLGDFRVIPLHSLGQSRCQLLQEVWADVPVVWEGGRPIRRLPPDGHECSAPF